MKRIAVLALATVLMGCSAVTTPPTTDNQLLALNAAKTVALIGCQQLKGSIKPNELVLLNSSLTVMGELLGGMQGTPVNPAALNAAVSRLDPKIAPYAPVILILVNVAAANAPATITDTMYYALITGVVQQCAVGTS